MNKKFTEKERKELIEARKQEMEHILPNHFTFCLGKKVFSRSIESGTRREK